MSKKKLTEKELNRIASLARLKLTKEETNKFTPQLSEILNYFEKLQEVNTKSVKPTYHPNPETNRFQELELESDTLPVGDVIKNAKRSKDDYVLTDQVIK